MWCEVFYAVDIAIRIDKWKMDCVCTFRNISASNLTHYRQTRKSNNDDYIFSSLANLAPCFLTNNSTADTPTRNETTQHNRNRFRSTDSTNCQSCKANIYSNPRITNTMRRWSTRSFRKGRVDIISRY